MMNIPNFPTDNLYKFITLFGFAIFLAGLYFLNDADERLIALYVESGKYIEKPNAAELMSQQADTDVQIEDKKSDYYIMTKQLESPQFVSLCRQYKDRKTCLDVVKHKYNIDAMMAEVEGHIKKMSAMQESVRQYNSAISDKVSEMRAFVRHSEATGVMMESRKWICYVCIIIGSLMMVVGFVLWYTKLQKPMDCMLLQDARIRNGLAQNESTGVEELTTP